MFWDVLIQYNHRSGPTTQIDVLTIGQSPLPWLWVSDKKKCPSQNEAVIGPLPLSWLTSAPALITALACGCSDVKESERRWTVSNKYKSLDGARLLQSKDLKSMFPFWSEDADGMESSRETCGEIISSYHCWTDADSDPDTARGGLLQALRISLEKALQRRYYTKHPAISKCSL